MFVGCCVEIWCASKDHTRSSSRILVRGCTEVTTLLGVSQLPTSDGYLQTDGLVERFNRTLKQML